MQKRATLEAIRLLRKTGVSGRKEKRVEFFFYARKFDDADLYNALKKLGYRVELDQSPTTAHEYCINGLTGKMVMTQGYDPQMVRAYVCSRPKI